MKSEIFAYCNAATFAQFDVYEFSSLGALLRALLGRRGR